MLCASPPLALADLIFYSLSSVDLVDERVVKGQMVGWAKLLASAGRFYTVIEDSPRAEGWLARTGCATRRHSVDGRLQGGLGSSSAHGTSLDSPVLRGTARCPSGLRVLLTACASSYWGTHGFVVAEHPFIISSPLSPLCPNSTRPTFT